MMLTSLSQYVHDAPRVANVLRAVRSRLHEVSCDDLKEAVAFRQISKHPDWCGRCEWPVSVDVFTNDCRNNMIRLLADWRTQWWRWDTSCESMWQACLRTSLRMQSLHSTQRRESSPSAKWENGQSRLALALMSGILIVQCPTNKFEILFDWPRNLELMIRGNYKTL